MNVKVFNCIIFIINAIIIANAQYESPDGIFPDAVFDANIKTSRIAKQGWDMSYPFHVIDDDNPLIMTFDELSKNVRYYSYAIIHCDADWRQSRLSPNEYLSGFSVNRLNSYEYSFNTLIPYVHYRLTIPNEDVHLKVSGNYVVLVFEDGNEARPLLCRRFCIVEPLVVFSSRAGMARQTARQREWQQVDFTARTANYRIENPYNDLKLVILQNGLWHSARTGIKPLFIRQNELDYRYVDETLLFSAGNEFRPLDIKSRQYSSTRMSDVKFEAPTYHFYPYIDISRETGHYLFYEDLNGKYAIQADKSNRHETEADYVFVHFALQAAQPYDDGQIYVMGDFCNYSCSSENMMKYNAVKQQYEATILLKQGYYNYKYEFFPFKSTSDENRIEGNYYETENDYVILLYHRDRSTRYDKLIGVSIANTATN